MIEKMPGEYEDKFNSLRAFYAYMMAHPGKKLLFMGQEFAQFIEWDYKKQLDWLLLDYDVHKKMQNFVKELNKFYLDYSQLWEIDYSWEGFEWISNDDNSQSIIAFRRKNKIGEEIIAICNFVPVGREDYRIGVPKAGYYRRIFCTDDEKFGGKTVNSEKSFRSQKISMHGFDNSVAVPIPPLSRERRRDICLISGWIITALSHTISGYSGLKREKELLRMKSAMLKNVVSCSAMTMNLNRMSGRKSSRRGSVHSLARVDCSAQMTM